MNLQIALWRVRDEIGYANEMQIWLDRDQQRGGAVMTTSPAPSLSGAKFEIP